MKWILFERKSYHDLLQQCVDNCNPNLCDCYDLILNKNDFIKDDNLPFKDRHFLVTDGLRVWLVYIDHCNLWFISETDENEEEIEKRITHWALLSYIPLP